MSFIENTSGFSFVEMKNNFKTILTSENNGVFTIQLNRGDANNSLNAEMLSEISVILEEIDDNQCIKVIIIEGLSGFFCTGMDFNELNEGGPAALIADDPNKFYNVLLKLSLSSKVVISKVDGKVNAGGIGIIAASDIVIASEKSIFSLSEALFGLIPACVMPFLVRRVGFQKAQWLTLTTKTISANEALQIGLIDELTNELENAVRLNVLRINRLNTITIAETKKYISDLWIINEQTKQLAVNKITDLIQSEIVRSNIKNFIEKGAFPWNK